MSGGSYDYAYCDMEAGQLDKALREVESAASHLWSLIEKPIETTFAVTESTDKDGRVHRIGGQRKLTDRERALTEMGLVSLVMQLIRFEAQIKDASNSAKEIAALFHVLEWIASGDSSVDALHDYARKWAAERLGIPS